MRKIYFLLLFLILLPYVAVAQDSQEGYTIDYAAETITIDEGYEVYTEATGGTQIQSGNSITDYIGQSLYIQKSGSETTGRTEISIPDRPAAPTNAGTVTNQTQNTIMIGSENGQEYRCGTGGTWGDWQTDSDGLITFENLSPGTEYTIQNRYQSGKDENGQEHFASFTNSTTSVTLPSITTTSLETGYVGVAYSDQLEAVVAEGTNVTWSLENSSLPAGLTLNGDGTISGTPTTAGQFSVIVKVAIFGELGQERAGTMGQLSITISKSDAELGGLTVTGQTGFEGHFQYGDIITVTFTPQLRVTTSTKSLEENTATLTYTNAEGEEVTLATATAGDDGSFTLTYDTKEKKLPIGEDLTLTVSYGGSSGFNPVQETVTLTLDQAYLRNIPTVTGSFVYGETLTISYTPQDDETVTYQWWRIIDDEYTERIDGATGKTYTLTEAEIGRSIYVFVDATDDWHYGKKQSDQYEIGKASLDEDAIEITTSESTIELGSEGTILTATITGIEDVNKAENWIWESSNKDIVEVNRLTPEALTTRSADNPIESTARVIPVGVGTATITVIYDCPTYHGEKTYEITVKEKEEEEPEEPVTPDYPDYYNIYVEECEGVTVETSTNVVREGNSMSFTVEVAEGYTAENMTVKVKRSLFGYTDVIVPNEEGKYEIRNIWTEIYITVEGVEKETPTGIEEITGVKVYTKDGSLYVQTPKQEEVRIISISGAVIKNETQIGLKRYDLPRGIYIICIGEERVKVRN